MLGAALSYLLVGFAGTIWMLTASRVVVGLVKATGTLATALAADESSSPQDRAARIAQVPHTAWLQLMRDDAMHSDVMHSDACTQVKAATAAGFLTGQFFSGMLAAQSSLGVLLPPRIASALFLCNCGLVGWLRPSAAPPSASRVDQSWWALNANWRSTVGNGSALAVCLLLSLVNKCVWSMEVHQYHQQHHP